MDYLFLSEFLIFLDQKFFEYQKYPFLILLEIYLFEDRMQQDPPHRSFQ